MRHNNTVCVAWSSGPDVGHLRLWFCWLQGFLQGQRVTSHCVEALVVCRNPSTTSLIFDAYLADAGAFEPNLIYTSQQLLNLNENSCAEAHSPHLKLCESLYSAHVAAAQPRAATDYRDCQSSSCDPIRLCPLSCKTSSTPQHTWNNACLQ